jgi:DNA-binding response OmpR family regulator
MSSAAPNRILVVEDDPVIQELMAVALQAEGFDVSAAEDATRALRLIEQQPPDLAILDVNLGALSGFDLLRDLRFRHDFPVVMVTGRGSAEDILRGFDLGANDYVTKPFHYRELVARIRVHLGPKARTAQTEPDVLHVGVLVLDRARHALNVGGRPIAVSPTEFRVLECLMRQAGRVVATRTLVREAWGYDEANPTDLVRAAIYRLRKKLVAAGSPILPETIPGVGVIIHG